MSDWKAQAEAWWETSIIDMAPGRIAFHGRPVEELIGTLSFVEMIWLMLRGDVPAHDQARLLESALVASVDHGPQAPSVAITRMAATCGVGINSALASGINALGDVHGGAGEQAALLYARIIAEQDGNGGNVARAAGAIMDQDAAAGRPHVPGFGHRFHDVDPRAVRLMELVEQAVEAGTVPGRHAGAALAIAAEIERRKGRPIPMNIDGATAVIFCELGFPPTLCRGLFILSRSVGLLAHGFEQMQRGERNKGPLPRDALWKYTGKPNAAAGGGETSS
ncbi:citryl-CoA lyase [Mesorhizobium sp. CAU 1741]|uniref:citryl-CoA lyase n=1 Tax=Mesorhizobium sp. CAU 1741 TaxID=3140366 RepID=UPI00325B3F06